MIELTVAQSKAIEILKKRWDKVGEPTPYGGSDPCVMVQVKAANGATMWLGIEPDGHTHS
tara:strand:+ start:1932 stop:2111 length:180 start_codon:yes stop_codon:yes gene_type:complete